MNYFVEIDERKLLIKHLIISNLNPFQQNHQKTITLLQQIFISLKKHICPKIIQISLRD